VGGRPPNSSILPRNSAQKEMSPAYEAHNGALTAKDIERIRKATQPMLPKGKVINTRSLL
jgi:hypothetical protein